ncbi:MAG: HmuY family protein [Chitinophagaceae bacterium]|nr:HmuY family protein [Chitinophagaceae bacterium]
MRKHYLQSTLCIFFLSLLFTSCLKEELPVPQKAKGDEQSATVQLGEDYRWQVYYSLKLNSEVGRNLYTTWDLGFENGANGRRIFLNGAKFKMVIYKTNKYDLDAVSITDTIGVASQIDMPSGSLDSTAIGNWKPSEVFIVHRGTDELGNDLGLRKIQILSVSATSYSVRFAELDGSNAHSLTLTKDNAYNFVHLSFDDAGKIVKVEPPKAEWDIVFTKYTYYYSDLDMRYSVVGAVVNSYNTNAGLLDSISSFESIDLAQAAKVSLSPFKGAIGFEWKTYDINSGKFTVNASKLYVIQSSDGLLYKMRFIDFYKSGIKGNPQWEYQRL